MGDLYSKVILKEQLKGTGRREEEEEETRQRRGDDEFNSVASTSMACLELLGESKANHVPTTILHAEGTRLIVSVSVQSN